MSFSRRLSEGPLYLLLVDEGGCWGDCCVWWSERRCMTFLNSMGWWRYDLDVLESDLLTLDCDILKYNNK